MQVLVLIFAAAFSIEGKSMDGDPGAVEFTRVDFVSLWTDRDALDGKPVALSGYLVAGPSGLRLFMGKSHFEYQQGYGGVAVKLDAAAETRVVEAMTARVPWAGWVRESTCPVALKGIYRKRGLGENGSQGVIEADADGVSIRSGCAKSLLPRPVRHEVITVPAG